MKKKTILIMLLSVIFILLVMGSYVTWNRLDPAYTCARCHEISPSYEKWTASAHAEVKCIECHGTALSNGIQSISDKTGMVLTHFTENTYNDDIHLTEAQILEISDNCAKCHRAEHAGWLAGGHAVNYKEIFMDSVHNKMEKPYWDCFRCHGMFYDGNIHDLMTLDGDYTEWMIKNEKQKSLPAVPCISCHQMHTPNPVSGRYVSMTDSTRTTIERNHKTALYIRSEKMHFRSDLFSKMTMVDEKGQPVETAGDPATLLCQQCHAPDYARHIGSQDDRSITGAHAGISCIACHSPHSGTTKQSCVQCHPLLTDEEIRLVYENPHSFQLEIEKK